MASNPGSPGSPMPRRGQPVLTPGRAALLAFLLITAVLALTRQALVPYNATPEQRHHLFSGDEPEYLLAAFNLAHGQGLTLGLRDKQGFLPPQRLEHIMEGRWHGGYDYFLTISPELGRAFTRQAWGGDKQKLVHRPGTSVLLALAAWAGERQRWWSYAILASLAAGLTALMVWWAARAGAPAGLALVAGLACLLSPPALFYGQQAFPELPQALLLTLAAVLLLRPSGPAALAAALCLALAPWFSDRALPPALFLGLSAWLAAPGRGHKALVLAILLLDLAGLGTYYYHHLGVPWPRNTHTVLKASLGYIPLGFLQLFFSGLQGLVFFFPLVGLLPLAAWQWWRSGWQRRHCLLWSLAWCAAVAGVAAWEDWGGGTCARGRYAVPVQLLTLPAWLAWARLGFSRRQALALALLAAWGLAYGAVVALNPKWWFAKFHPIFNLDTRSPLFAWLPDMAQPSMRAYVLCAAWSLGLVGLNWWLARGPRPAGPRTGLANCPPAGSA
ncbi:MAG: hypothetical protein HY910_13190 [Desulfarculus sp.]|nr:hypothetical protein [Desulfarculus sp.]